MKAMEAPFSLLPEVKDKNGVVVVDVKEKRLELVRQHVQTAGEIINLVDQSQTSYDMVVGMTLEKRYRPQVENVLGVIPPPECGEDGCKGEPAHEFGFGSRK